MEQITITLPSIEDVEFSLNIEPEHIPVKGNAIVSGDVETDKKVEDEIFERLDRGDLWAWCTVEVTAEWKGLEGVNYLGCCCYADEKEFKAEGGHYEDMKQEAYNDLIAQLKQLATPGK